MLLQKYEVKSYTFAEYRNELVMEDLNKFDRVIAHIKKNKTMYLKLVILLAITIDRATLNVLAETPFATGLDELSDKLVGMLVLIAKFGCMGMGLKEMVVTTLNGGNLREATISGVQYWMVYIALQLYPTLYDLVEGLKFE